MKNTAFPKIEKCFNALQQPGTTLFNILQKDPFPVAIEIWQYLKNSGGPTTPFTVTNVLGLAKGLREIEMQYLGPRKQPEPIEEGVWLLEDTFQLPDGARHDIAILRQKITMLKEFLPEKFYEFVTLGLESNKIRTSGDLRRLAELLEAVLRCIEDWGLR